MDQKSEPKPTQLPAKQKEAAAEADAAAEAAKLDPTHASHGHQYTDEEIESREKAALGDAEEGAEVRRPQDP